MVKAETASRGDQWRRRSFKQVSEQQASKPCFSGWNFGGMCGFSPDGIWLRRSTAQSNGETEVSSEPANEQASNEQSFCVDFKRPDLSPPMGDCPNQIVLVGQSPNTSYSKYEVPFFCVNFMGLVGD